MSFLYSLANYNTYSILRIYICGSWLFVVLFDPLQSLANFPVDWFYPVGFLLYFLPSEMKHFLIDYNFLIFLKISLILCLTAMILNWKFFIFGPLGCIFLTIYQGTTKGFLFIGNKGISFLLAVYILTFLSMMNWKHMGKKISTGSSTKENFFSIPFVFILTLFTLVLSLLGIHRLVWGGIELFFTDSIIWHIIQSSREAAPFGWNFDELMTRFTYIDEFFKLGFIIITIFEVMAPMALISKRFRYVFLAIFILFHFLNWFFLGIFFWSHILLLLLLFDFSIFQQKAFPQKALL